MTQVQISNINSSKLDQAIDMDKVNTFQIYQVQSDLLNIMLGRIQDVCFRTCSNQLE